MTNFELISQVRNQLKSVTSDSRMTDKFIWSIINKHARWLIKRESDKLKLMRLDFLFQTLKCVPVIEAPAIDDCCGIKSKCLVYRTEKKIPKMFEDSTGIIIKSVFSIDGGYDWTPIRVQEYSRKVENPHSKWDKSRYFYYNNGHLYFPNPSATTTTFPRKVMIKGYFEEDIRKYNCCGDEADLCLSKQEEEYRIPDGIIGELMDFVIKDLANVYLKITPDTEVDKNENRRN